MRSEGLHPTNRMRRDFQDRFRRVDWCSCWSLCHCAYFAQNPPPPSPPDPPAAPPRNKTPSQRNRIPTARRRDAPDQPTWDPLRAEKDMQVGDYYMHKGDLDAAIDRFQDATTRQTRLRASLPAPGRSAREKGDEAAGDQILQRYLDLYPHAEDKDKIQKKIDKLYKDVEKEKKSM